MKLTRIDYDMAKNLLSLSDDKMAALGEGGILSKLHDEHAAASTGAQLHRNSDLKKCIWVMKLKDRSVKQKSKKEESVQIKQVVDDTTQALSKEVTKAKSKKSKAQKTKKNK